MLVDKQNELMSDLLFIVHQHSLPADVLWGSFVTHSFLPHGRLLNRADIPKANYCSFFCFLLTMDECIINVWGYTEILPKFVINTELNKYQREAILQIL